jgi:hypothetical protein
VHRLVAAEIDALMRELYDLGFPLQSARPIEDFGGSDDASMQANNTSAFNCRAKTPAVRPDGTGAPVEYSVHSYGTAIDINPRNNPTSSRATSRSGTRGASATARRPRPTGSTRSASRTRGTARCCRPADGSIAGRSPGCCGQMTPS